MIPFPNGLIHDGLHELSASRLVKNRSSFGSNTAESTRLPTATGREIQNLHLLTTGIEFVSLLTDHLDQTQPAIKLLA